MAESGFVLAPPLQRQSGRSNQITKETQGGKCHHYDDNGNVIITKVIMMEMTMAMMAMSSLPS